MLNRWRSPSGVLLAAWWFAACACNGGGAPLPPGGAGIGGAGAAAGQRATGGDPGLGEHRAGSAGVGGNGGTAGSGADASGAGGSNAGEGSSAAGSGGTSPSNAGAGGDSGGIAGGGSGGASAHEGPPMGFNPYNTEWCNATEANLRAFADAMVQKGLLGAGYEYLNLDCAWQGSRNASGEIQANSNYPSGIKALADYAHGKGLKFGIYTAPGAMTCDNKPGSQGHETEDVNSFASWGVEYIKLDWCGADYSANGAANLAQKWQAAIAATGRPMVLSINAGASQTVASWAQSRVNLWRVGDDICDTWLNKTGARNSGYAHCTSTTVQNGIYDYLTMPLDYLQPYSGKGHWGDPDMLQVGNPGLNLEEAKTHFSIWAMWSAPLLAGNDLTKMNGSDIASQVLLNREVIAIDQDPKNEWAVRVKNTASALVYKKRLALSGDHAIAIVNLSGSAQSITIKWSDVGLSRVTALRDLWLHKDLTPEPSGFTANAVPAHGTVLLRLTGS
jgi:alpha-galactosidase